MVPGPLKRFLALKVPKIPQGLPASAPRESESLADDASEVPHCLGHSPRVRAVNVDIERVAREVIARERAAVTISHELNLALSRATALSDYEWYSIVAPYINKRRRLVEDRER